MDKILVVDDDLDILSLVQTILTMNNFAVVALSSWEEIESKIETFKPNLVLLDVMLNGADGREICRNLNINKNLPVVLFSANSEMQKDITKYNAKGFIAKPFEISDFVETIKANVSHN